MNAPKILWYDDEECSAGPTKFHPHEVEYVRADLVEGLVEALSQITEVYTAMRENLSKMYPKDGWSTETLTLDKARAALTKLEDRE